MRSLAFVLFLSFALPSAVLGQVDELDTPSAADPADSTEPSAPAVRSRPRPRPPGTVRVRVESNDPRTRLYRTEYVGRTQMGWGAGQPPPGVPSHIPAPVLGEYRLLCEAPCVLDLPMGSYLFGVQEDDGRIRFRRGTFDNYMQITRSGVLRIDVPNTAWRRVLGMLLMVGGGAGFALAMQRLDSGVPLIATTVSMGTLTMIGILALVFPVMPTVEYDD